MAIRFENTHLHNPRLPFFVQHLVIRIAGNVSVDDVPIACEALYTRCHPETEVFWRWLVKKLVAEGGGNNVENLPRVSEKDLHLAAFYVS
jgi:hypothetical protein